MALNYNAAVTIKAEYKGQGDVAKAKSDFKELDGSAKKATGAFGDLGKTMKTLAGAYAVRQTFLFAKSIIDLGDNLNDLRQKTGIGVQALSNLKAAAEDNGLEFGELEGSLRKFSVTVSKATTDGSSSAAAFKALGISVKDAGGSLKSSDVLIGEVADKFSKLPDGAQKARIAVELFGRAGADMIPLLNQGSEALDKFGVKISDEFALRADVFNDTMNELKRNGEQFGVNLLDGLLPTLQEIGKAFVDFTGDAGEMKEITQKVGDAFRVLAVIGAALATALVEGFDVIYTSFKRLGEDIAFIAANIGDRFSTLTEQAKAAAALNFEGIAKLEEEYETRKKDRVEIHEKEVDTIREEFMKREAERLKRLNALNEKLSKNFGNAAGAAADTKPDPKKKPTRSGADFSGLGDDNAKKLDQERKALDDLNLELQESIALRELEAQKLDITNAEYEKRKLAITEGTKADKKSNEFSKANQAEYKKLTQAIIEQKQAVKDLEEANKRSFGAGAKAAFKEYVDTATDSAAQTKRLFGAAFQGLEDALVDFVKTGKLSFADLANTISDMLLRLAIQRSIAAAITAVGLGAAADGGILGPNSSVPIKAYARGGVANSPQVAIFGEAGPEAYVPLPDGRTIPVTIKGGESTSGGGTTVSVTVNMYGNGESDQSSKSDTDKGKALGQLIAATVDQKLLEAKRPGGMLA